MKTYSRTLVATGLALMLLTTALAAQQDTPTEQIPSSNNANNSETNSQPASPLPANSEARIVRLSQMQGNVQIDRNTGQGYENALLNLPVTQGAKLRTGSGLAEVEFEDNSILHLTPNTVVQFQRLELLQSGAKASTVNVEAGTAYVSLAKTKGNEFAMAFGHEKLMLAPSSHIRLRVGHTKASLAVFAGDVQAEGPAGATAVGKKKTLTFDLASQSEPVLSKKVTEGRYDAWDQFEIDYHKQYAKSSAYGSIPNLSGISDMNYYGQFVQLGDDCGTLWRPYFANAAWDPFANGTWAWYPGSGWTWVSPYPWGWTAYHFGDWEYCPARGWGWRPRGYWVGLTNVPQPIKPPHGYPPPRPPRPPLPSAPGHPELVAVNTRPTVASALTAPGTFVLRQDSAGLGLPRSDLENLGKLSGRVEQRGSITIAAAPLADTGSGRAASPGSTSSGQTPSSRTGAASYSNTHLSTQSNRSATGRTASAGGSGHMSMGGGSRSVGGGGGGSRSGGGGGGGGAHK